MKIKTKLTIFTVALATLIMLGATMAYFSAAQALHNPMITKGSDVYLQEVFNEKDKWLPGETKEKVVRFGNKGDTAQVIRFKADTEWFLGDGTTAWTPATPNPVEIHWTTYLSSEWTLIGGWYYYNKPLLPGQQTNEVMDWVKFSNLISNGGPGAEDFSDKIFRLTINMESLDVSAIITNAEWGRAFTGTNTLAWS